MSIRFCKEENGNYEVLKEGNYLGEFMKHRNIYYFDPAGPLMSVKNLRQIADKLDELNGRKPNGD